MADRAAFIRILGEEYEKRGLWGCAAPLLSLPPITDEFDEAKIAAMEQAFMLGVAWGQKGQGNG